MTGTNPTEHQSEFHLATVHSPGGLQVAQSHPPHQQERDPKGGQSNMLLPQRNLGMHQEGDRAEDSSRGQRSVIPNICSYEKQPFNQWWCFAEFCSTYFLLMNFRQKKKKTANFFFSLLQSYLTPFSPPIYYWRIGCRVGQEKKTQDRKNIILAMLLTPV